MSKRTLMVILISLLAVFQAQLWFGRGSLSNVAQFKKQFAELTSNTSRLQLENSQLKAEVEDLKGGIEMVEEKARSELGMIKPNEIYIQFAK
jgi:cell division protein FtsB